MRYTPASSSLFIHNREKLKALLPHKGLAILTSNAIMPTNADGTMGFRQNSDLYYLSGIDQEDTLLVVFPGAADPAYREILFIRETSEEIAIWEGDKLTKAQAAEHSGVKTILWSADFYKTLRGLMAEAQSVWLNSNEHTRADIQIVTREMELVHTLKQQYPLHQYQRLAPLMHQLRAVKSSEEIELIAHACQITEKGFRRLLSFVKPGVTEYQIEAELIHEFISNRAEGFAYGPIIASGFNACVLHYHQNAKTCEAGELLLLDVAARYANYASDLTRCIPVSGRFSPRQKAIYNAVLRVQKQAIQTLKPGVILREFNQWVGQWMEKELVDLGLISMADIASQNPAWPAYKKYFMHGTSHFLGLDVHDVGFFNEPLQAGMVLTVEPGIYVREEGIGVRIENNVVIQENGAPLDLMASIPREVEELESLMNA
jgi:Xaa-Pro aminopeptidase